MRRANIGCGSIAPEGWDNYDLDDWDVRFPLRECELSAIVNGTTTCHGNGRCAEVREVYDYAVCSFMLQELNFHELPDTMVNLRAILKPRGVLRILVPDVLRAFAAFVSKDEDWFPQDERSGGLDGKFCSYITWFGTSKSVFNEVYLKEVAYMGDFEYVRTERFGSTRSAHGDITSLDSRPREALIVEAVR